MTSIRESILSRIQSRLATMTTTGGRSYRSRAEAVSRGEMPCVIVEPMADTAEAIGGMCKIDRSLAVKVAILIHADVPDQAADPIGEELYSKLIATGDTTLGGLAIDIQPTGDDFRFAATDGVIVHNFEVRYRHDTFALGSP